MKRNRTSGKPPQFIASSPAGSSGLVVQTPNQDYYILPFGDMVLNQSAATQVFPVANVVRLYQFNLLAKVTFTRMTINIGTLFVGGNAVIGIYTVAPGTNPGSLITQAVFSTTTTGFKTTVISQVTLNPGTYWLAYSEDNTTAQIGGVPIGNGLFSSGSILRFVFTQTGMVATVLPASTGNTQANGLNNSNTTPYVLLEP